MSKLLTAAWVSEDLRHWKDGDHTGEEEHINRANHTIMALAQRLADSPCPVCGGSGRKLEKHSTGEGIVSLSNAKFVYDPCPHCGGFPDDRKGKAFATKEAAIDSLGDDADRMTLDTGDGDKEEQ